MLCSFFFYYLSRPRNLLSFPTRRSSDLSVEALEEALAAAHQRLQQRMADEVDQDRKSTRLNSSHTVISYAVFCLKKKKLFCKPAPTEICTNSFCSHAVVGDAKSASNSMT